MAYGYIVFIDKEQSPQRITPEEYKKICETWDTANHFYIQGHIIHKFAISHLIPPKKPEPLTLPSPQESPISLEALNKFKEEMAKRFQWNKKPNVP